MNWFSNRKNKTHQNFHKQSVKSRLLQAEGGDRVLKFRDPNAKGDPKTPSSGKEFTGTFMPAYPFHKFEKRKEAANLYCPYSTTDYVENKNVTQYNAGKRVDTTTPIIQKEEAKKLWSSRLVSNEEVDVYKVLKEAGEILVILDGKRGTEKDLAEDGQDMFKHFRCHLINTKAVRKKETESGKNQKSSFLIWKEGQISHLEIIAPTRLTTTGNETISMQLDKYLQSQGSKRIPEQQLVQFCYQICLGLKWFHENNFVFKDLRCRNVLVEKRGHNWLARLMAPGLGSLVKYVKDGYGWRNIRNSAVHRNPNSTRNYSNKIKEAGGAIGPLSEPTDINTVFINRPLSRPPGKDRKCQPQDDSDVERIKSVRRRAEASNNLIRHNSNPDLSSSLSKSSPTTESGLNSPSPSESFSLAGDSGFSLAKCASNESVDVNNANKSVKINENLVKNWHSGGNFEERKLALNEQAVYWQPPEIHDALMKKFEEHLSRRDAAQKSNPTKTNLEKHFTPESDIWSLGATFWEVMTYGKVPFRDNLNFSFDLTLDAKKLIQGNVFKSQNYKLERASWHQEHMHYLIQSCMSFDKDNRPSLNSVLNHYMLNVLSENGQISKDVRCQCGRFIQKRQRKLFVWF